MARDCAHFDFFAKSKDLDATTIADAADADDGDILTIDFRSWSFCAMCLAPAILYYSPEAAVDLSQILSFKKPKIYLILKKYHIISPKIEITFLHK